jgi:ankyrin repeat protein
MATDMSDAALMSLVRTIVAGDDPTVFNLLATSPALARVHFERGASRETAMTYHMDKIGHYINARDTALHLAAAAYRREIAQKLIAMGADARAKNRRGAEPLHYAADGMPGSSLWDPDAQAATVTCLIEAGADPNATDKSGVTPLHRAVRTRCAAAVKALLEGGADPRLKNRSGSTPMLLATQNTGRGGSGSREAKAQQEQIVKVLEEYLNMRS